MHIKHVGLLFPFICFVVAEVSCGFILAFGISYEQGIPTVFAAIMSPLLVCLYWPILFPCKVELRMRRLDEMATRYLVK